MGAEWGHSFSLGSLESASQAQHPTGNMIRNLRPLESFSVGRIKCSGNSRSCVFSAPENHGEGGDLEDTLNKPGRLSNVSSEPS